MRIGAQFICDRRRAAGSVLQAQHFASRARYLIVAPIAATTNIEAALTRAAPANAGDEALWSTLDIEAGIPSVVAATQEQFLPQTVNFDFISTGWAKPNTNTANVNLGCDGLRPWPVPIYGDLGYTVTNADNFAAFTSKVAVARHPNRRLCAPMRQSAKLAALSFQNLRLSSITGSASN